MSNPLWEYSLTVYGLDGIAPTCLELQDRCGLDVNLLLYAAWLASMGLHLDEAHLAGLETLVGPWRGQVVLPLRDLRRSLRAWSRAETIRDAIKTLELRAEQEQQDMMYAYFRSSVGLTPAPRALAKNLALVARAACPETVGWEEGIGRLASLVPP